MHNSLHAVLPHTTEAPIRTVLRRNGCGSDPTIRTTVEQTRTLARILPSLAYPTIDVQLVEFPESSVGRSQLLVIRSSEWAGSINMEGAVTHLEGDAPSELCTLTLDPHALLAAEEAIVRHLPDEGLPEAQAFFDLMRQVHRQTAASTRVVQPDTVEIWSNLTQAGIITEAKAASRRVAPLQASPGSPREAFDNEA